MFPFDDIVMKSYAVNNVAVDNPVMKGARVSKGVVLT